MDEWFVVPPEEVPFGDGTTVTRPKYADTEGIDAFTGNVMHFDRQTYSNRPWKGKTMYVARFYGTLLGIQAVRDQQDAYSKATTPMMDQDIADFLNDMLDTNRPFSEWAESFKVE